MPASVRGEYNITETAGFNITFGISKIYHSVEDGISRKTDYSARVRIHTQKRKNIFFYSLYTKKHLTVNCPKLCGQHKNSLNGRKYYKSSNKLTSLFEWCQFCFELDTFVVIKMHLIGLLLLMIVEFLLCFVLLGPVWGTIVGLVVTFITNSTYNKNKHRKRQQTEEDRRHKEQQDNIKALQKELEEFVDYSRVNNSNKPLFCIGSELADDGGSGRYVGLGYSFNIDGHLENSGKYEIDTYIYKVLGIAVKEVLRPVPDM